MCTHLHKRRNVYYFLAGKWEAERKPDGRTVSTMFRVIRRFEEMVPDQNLVRPCYLSLAFNPGEVSADTER